MGIIKKGLIMSEFTNKSELRIKRLTEYTVGLIEKRNGKELLDKYEILSTKFTPLDILITFDNLFELNIDLEVMKKVSNKLFNALYSNLKENVKLEYKKDSIVDYLVRDNKAVINHLKTTKKYIKEINNEIRKDTIKELIKSFEEFQKFTIHYTVKENIIFPEMEKRWEHFQCLKLMWSFHDDIRRNISKALEILKSDSFDLKLFNYHCTKSYFDIHTIIIREEKVLFPIMIDTFDKEILDNMLKQVSESGLHYVEIKAHSEGKQTNSYKNNLIKLATGEINIEQLELIFNHLPVDITFVDETDTVKYFSTPKHRIFPRSTGIIGRKVQNCHPPESVGIVNKIVASFKNGDKDKASFWIKMKENYVLIEYFAVRDEQGTYKGVLEVSQEISGIQKIRGERRLLDW